MKTFRALVVAIALVAPAFAASSKVPDISLRELEAAIATKHVTLLDVNGTESFKEGRIPGAIDYLAHEKEIASLLPKDKHALVVAYCGNEYCSAYLAAATTALQLGYTNVKHYAPGIDGWKKSGAKVEADVPAGRSS
jgi:rhodanese-related sulfurtransferase